MWAAAVRAPAPLAGRGPGPAHRCGSFAVRAPGGVPGAGKVVQGREEVGAGSLPGGHLVQQRGVAVAFGGDLAHRHALLTEGDDQLLRRRRPGRRLGHAVTSVATV